MAPKKPTVTSSSTRSARAKTGSNPVVTKGEARTRAARTTLGPAPKQRPMASGGTKGPLQGGTRTAGRGMDPRRLEAGPAKIGPVPPKPSRGITMSGDKQAAIKGAGNPAGPRAPKPSWDQKGNLKRPALPSAGQTSGNRTATRIQGMRNRIIANTAAGKPSGVRTGQPANIKGALPAAGKTSGNQANAVKSIRVAGMQARRAAEAAAGKPSSVRQGQPAGAANRMYGANRVNAAVARAQQSQNPLNRLGRTIAKGGKGAVKLLGKVGKIGAGLAAGPIGYGLLGGEILGEAGKAFRRNSPFDSKNDSANRRANPEFQPLRAMTAAEMRNAPKLTQYDPNSPAAKPAASTSRFAGARDKAMAKAKAIKGSPVVGPKAASAPARMSAPAARSSAPKATAPKASAPKASAPSGPARMSASTYNRMSGNYGTSRSNNPLMANFKDSLPSKAADPDAGYSPKTKVSSEGIKGAPTDVTKLAFSNPKLSAERTRKIKRG